MVRIFFFRLGITNVLGKTLCGNDFYFRLEDFGFTLKTKQEEEVIILNANDTRFNLTRLENTTTAPPPSRIELHQFRKVPYDY
jgi:hypothetical protein